MDMDPILYQYNTILYLGFGIPSFEKIPAGPVVGAAAGAVGPVERSSDLGDANPGHHP